MRRFSIYYRLIAVKWCNLMFKNFRIFFFYFGLRNHGFLDIANGMGHLIGRPSVSVHKQYAAL